jgi:hypothetical protein
MKALIRDQIGRGIRIVTLRACTGGGATKSE